VAKPVVDKSFVINIIVIFCVALAVMLVLPALLDASGPNAALAAAQAAAIAVLLGILQRVRIAREEGPKADAGLPGNAGDASKTRTDDLTGVLSQRGMTVKLLELMALGERYGNQLSIAIIGIDHHEDVAQKYGRDVADKALVAITNELTDSLRMPDILGRWAEDEFIAILPETTLEGAIHIGERLREAVARAQFEGKRGVILSLTASIGVTVYRTGDDLQGLLSRATKAMQTARRQGRDRVSSDLAA
jgi:diguanylate cyclase (GGDEF)-like protein